MARVKARLRDSPLEKEESGGSFLPTLSLSLPL